jgi:VWFA-related protein
LAGLAVLLAPVTSPAAPKPAAEAAPRFEESSRVVSVEVPVEVVGRDGQPVRGLTAADFELFDEGARQTISSFDVVDLDHIGSAATQSPGGAALLAPSARRHFLLLFDLSFATPAAILRIREAAQDFVLHSLRPTDLAAVATYSLQTGARLVVTFTPDRAQLARGILSLGLDNVYNAAKPDPLRFVIAPPSLAALNGVGSPSRPEARGRADAVMSENLGSIRNMVQQADRSYGRDLVKSYIQSLGELAKILGSVPGRKRVILFSEGFDSRLLVGHDTTGAEQEADNLAIMFGEINQVDNDYRYGNTNLQGDMRRMLREFQRADCVIEAVDLSGLQAHGDASLQQSESRANGQEELFEMANGTGGELFTDDNNFKAQLSRVLERSTVTYVLTFERSDLKSDGAFRRLQVKTRVAGAKLSYRAGYYAPRPFQDLDPLAKVLLASDGIASAAPRSELDLNVLVSSFRSQAQRAYVPVIVEIGGERLVAGHNGKRLNVEIYAYVSDMHGEMQDYFTQRVAVDLAKMSRDVLASGLKYYGHLDVPAGGDYRVRVLVRDAENGRTAVRSEALSIPAYEAGKPVLLPPFFIDSRSGWLMVREHGTEKSGKGTVVYPFTVNGEPYVPAALAALGGGEQAKLCLVAYNLGAGDLALQGKVVGADGAALPGGRLELVARTSTGVSGLDKLLATFKPTGLGAGRYQLQVAVTDPRTGRQEKSSVPFEVVR